MRWIELWNWSVNLFSQLVDSAKQIKLQEKKTRSRILVRGIIIIKGVNPFVMLYYYYQHTNIRWNKKLCCMANR